MAVSSFATASSASYTDEGGTLVKSTNKRSASAYIALDSTLPAGSYLIKLTGSGTLFVNTYTGTTIGGKILTINADTTKSNMITIPAGVTGIYLSGPYSGPIIFQTVATAPVATIANKTFGEKSRKSEYTADVKNYKFIEGTDLAIKAAAGNNISIVNILTNTVVSTTTNGIFTWGGYGFPGTSELVRNGNTLVFSQGYTGSSTMRFFKSTDLGTNWTYSDISISNVPAAYMYNMNFAGDKYYAYACGDGYGNGASTKGHWYSTDAVTWTFQNPFFSYAWSDITYGNGVYVACQIGHFNNSGTYTNTYNTSTDGITWTQRYLPANPNTGSQSNYVDALMYVNSKFYMFTRDYNGNAPITYTSTDGINWTSVATGTYATMVSKSNVYGALNSGTANRYAVTSTGIWYLSSATGYVVFLKFSDNSLSVTYMYSAAGLATNDYPRIIQKLANGALLTTGGYSTSNYMLLMDNINNTSVVWNPATLSKFSGMPTAVPASKIFMSKKFNRYYYISSDNYLYYSAVGSISGWTKSAVQVTNGWSGYDLIFETENYLCLFSGSTTIQRSTDGINFVATTMQSTVSLPSYGPCAAVVGKTIVCRTGTTAGDYVVVSNDEGITWNVVTTNQIGTVGTGGALNVNATTGGFMAWQDNSTNFFFSKDGTSWTKMPTNVSATSAISVANDTAFWMQTTTSPAKYTKTSTSGVIATGIWNIPLGNYYITVNPLGTGFLMLVNNPISNTSTGSCYTSPDGITWTVYNLPNSGTWYPMMSTSTGDNTLLWDPTNKMFLELQETSTITLS